MSLPVINAEQLRRVVRFEDLIEPVSRAFQEYSGGMAANNILTMFPAPTPELGDVYVKTGSIQRHAVFIVKVSPWFAINNERNQPQGGFIAVFDAQTGHTAAILQDEHYLSDIRTAAAGVLAARTLAPGHVRVVGVLGTGVQAYWQSLALALARPFKKLLIWGRTAQNAARLHERLQTKLPGVDITVIASVEEVVRTADVLLTTTQAREPIVKGEWLRPGQHITAVGADDHTKCELDAKCLLRADRLIVDSLQSAQEHGEVHRWIQRGAITRNHVHGELGQVLAGKIPGRRSAEDITIAKLVGIGVQDLVTAEVALEKIQGGVP